MTTEGPSRSSGFSDLRSWPGNWWFALETLGIALIYMTTAKLGFLVAIPPGNVTVLWAPSGLALASIMTFGNRACLGIALGSFFANIWDLHDDLPLFYALATSLGIALGSTIQTAIVAHFLHRTFKLNLLIAGFKELLQFAVIAAIGCIIAATTGLISLGLGGLISPNTYLRVWSTWWLGDWVGMLVFSPLACFFVKWASRRAFIPLNMSAIIWSIGIGTSVFLFILMRTQENKRIQTELELDSHTNNNTIEETIHNSLSYLNSVSGLLISSDIVTREEFSRFANTLLNSKRQLSGIQALEWIPRVTASKRSYFEEQARKDGLESFVFTQRDETGQIVPVGQRSEYYPVYYVEPLKGNLQALGFDLASDPIRRKTLYDSRNTGQYLATSSITLVQETSRQKGFLIFQPMYGRNDRPNSLTGDADQIQGFALGVFRIDDMVKASLLRVPQRGLEIVILDKNSKRGDEVLYSNIKYVGNKSKKKILDLGSLKKGFFYAEKLEVAGRRWEIINRATDNYISHRRTTQSWITLLAGIGFTTLMILFVVSRQKIETVLIQTNLEQMRLNEEIKMQQTQLLLSEKMSSIGQLAAGIAHEINNPAGFVSGNFGTLQKYIDGLLVLLDMSEALIARMKDSSESFTDGDRSIAEFKKSIRYDFIRLDIKELISESIEGIERISQIVNELKDFSRIDNEEKLDLCNLEEIIEKTISMAWNELKYKCTLHKDYLKLPNQRLNRGNISQVILNLLVNAAQSITDTGDIYVRTRSENNDVILEIEDNGSGIPVEIQTKVFDPFFTTKPVGKGTGLGLHICQKIVAAHGGRIELNSEVGRGTLFRVILPSPETSE